MIELTGSVIFRLPSSSSSATLSKNFSENAEQILIKGNMKLLLKKGMRFCSNGSDPLAKMDAGRIGIL